jgi:hypothetical protein
LEDEVGDGRIILLYFRDTECEDRMWTKYLGAIYIGFGVGGVEPLASATTVVIIYELF